MSLCIDDRLVGAPNGHLYIYDIGHMAARNIYRIEINILEEELRVQLVIYQRLLK
jgi:hypothetical protein